MDQLLISLCERNAMSASLKPLHPLGSSVHSHLAQSFLPAISHAQTNLLLVREKLASKEAMLAMTESSLEGEKTEVIRLFETLQGIETQMQAAADERMELVRRVEHLKGELRLSDERVRCDVVRCLWQRGRYC